MYIDIKPLWTTIKNNIIEKISTLNKTITLAAVTLKPDDATQNYLKNQEKLAKKLGINYSVYEAINRNQLFSILRELSSDNNVHGIFVTHPLPGIEEMEAVNMISPEKDVEGRHPYNMGMLMYGSEFFAPCTAEAVVKILEDITKLSGANVVVVGRSTTVGKPLAIMLLRRDRSATVTVCHTRTRNLQQITRNADIVIAAAGKINLITSDMVKENSIVVDVGINVTDNGIVGDVNPEVSEKALVTPVPGGVGRITTIILMEHVVKAAEKLKLT
ncbi:bifunctional 5,10-methylenetetrahydrofolate dehydrogenase/5,10-methenyltetrahydrofolate cyclohydrolase [Thermosipho ferrireducens]|uniref:Bifunctional protein FolD n=1 Tax=Thermosipho ferrireducens TaxID=2571116 RepID=A0ABX7S7S1_9BACT|nr:bifunctional 5,10-methylenetetrahydrofolate dehydrogenase/5,10-methenyltetrahydrofolate cyclohydrolase [Thermosipho ferrireducens]QTA37958.1 bifunctional 5,10-methylenetetrahydrofolate dehydrogenase/5,10-methenyltetrahydrofolate cyclohydrolase [Thermosipho ferrireducens]